MALIPETGSIVENANSYVTLEEARTYAASYGVTLSLIDSEVEVFALKAKDYLESKGDKYKGVKSFPETQELQWPRFGAVVDGVLIASNVIPKKIKTAQMQLIIEQHNGVDIMPTFTAANKTVVEESVGLSAIRTKYSEKNGGYSNPVLQAVENLIRPFYKFVSYSFVRI